MLGCDAVVPGWFPELGEIFVRPIFISVGKLGVICDYLCICPWYPHYKLLLVRSYVCVCVIIKVVQSLAMLTALLVATIQSSGLQARCEVG